MPYSQLLVKPMREELSSIGFEELMTEAAVAAWKGKSEGTGFLVINSVCGCAAGGARPGVRFALDNAKRPVSLATVFAGQDVEATKAARELFPPDDVGADAERECGRALADAERDDALG